LKIIYLISNINLDKLMIGRENPYFRYRYLGKINFVQDQWFQLKSG